MVLPGLPGKNYLGRLEHDLWGSGVRDRKDPNPVTPKLKKRSWQPMKRFKLLPKWLAHRRTASLGTLTTSSGLDAQRESAFHTCHVSSWCPEPANSTAALLPWKTSRNDRTHGHRLNELNRHLGGMATWLQKWYLCLWRCIYLHINTNTNVCT